MLVANARAAPVEQGGNAAPTAEGSSPWLLVPVVSSSPKLGTSFGVIGAHLHEFDPSSRVSLFGVTYQYTSTHSTIAALPAHRSAPSHRIIGIAAFRLIKDD